MLNVTQARTVTRDSSYAPVPETRGHTMPVRPSPEIQASVQNTDPIAIRERVAKHVEELNRFVRARDAQIQFEIDDSGARVVTKIVDINTREVLRQIPSEEVLRMAEALSDSTESGSASSVQLLQVRA
jgi:flagellar protein FlaG